MIRKIAKDQTCEIVKAQLRVQEFRTKILQLVQTPAIRQLVAVPSKPSAVKLPCLLNFADSWRSWWLIRLPFKTFAAGAIFAGIHSGLVNAFVLGFVNFCQVLKLCGAEVIGIRYGSVLGDGSMFKSTLAGSCPNYCQPSTNN